MPSLPVEELSNFSMSNTLGMVASETTVLACEDLSSMQRIAVAATSISAVLGKKFLLCIWLSHMNENNAELNMVCVRITLAGVSELALVIKRPLLGAIHNNALSHWTL